MHPDRPRVQPLMHGNGPMGAAAEAADTSCSWGSEESARRLHIQMALGSYYELDSSWRDGEEPEDLPSYVTLFDAGQGELRALQVDSYGSGPTGSHRAEEETKEEASGSNHDPRRPVVPSLAQEPAAPGDEDSVAPPPDAPSASRK